MLGLLLPAGNRIPALSNYYYSANFGAVEGLTRWQAVRDSLLSKQGFSGILLVTEAGGFSQLGLELK